MILQPKLLVGFIGVFCFTEFGGFNGFFVCDSSSQKCFLCFFLHGKSTTNEGARGRFCWISRGQTTIKIGIPPDPQQLPPGLLSTFLERDPELTKPSFPPTTYKGSMPRYKQLRCPILDPKSQDFSSNMLQQHDHR